MGQLRVPEHYMVLCPKCGNLVLTEWMDMLPPGGVSPVECPCGYMILSESEGEPKQVEVFG